VKRFFLITAFFLSGVISLNAQLLDTLQYLFRQKYSVDLRLESRNSFIAMS
jgi:hypothetical protein